MTGDGIRVAGVDAGGSHSVAVVTDGALRVLGRAAGPGGAVRPDAVAASADVIVDTIGDALRAAGGGQLVACVVGAAGAGDPAVQSALADALRARGTPAHTMVTTDVDVAFASAFPEGPGILVLAGTGSIALARGRAGGRHRVGGRGWRVGDEGSGYALGRAGVAAVARALDGRAPDTVLTGSITAALGLHSGAELAAWAGRTEPRAIAALAALVQQAAEAGDPVAVELLDTAADDLVAHVLALRPHFAADMPVPVVLSGGALVPGRPLRRRVVTLLRSRTPWATVVDVEVDAALGAARMALRLDAETLRRHDAD
jgi:N-acetylglucosamine kinase-like BadF-type ATPase